jgi:hypothetical protein
VSRSIRLAYEQHHDPWWPDGRSARRRASRRTAADLAVLIVMLAVLALVWGAVPVRAASTTVNLDQWASTDNAWQNGNLNGNNSRYPEGGIVPFRLALEGLTTGKHTIHINYDFSAGGHKAYDFLATWDVTNAKGKACASSGGGISSRCPSLGSSSSFAFPSDPYTANGLTVRGAEAYSAAPRRLTIWGGTITSIKGPVHAGSPDGNSTADFVVTFSASRSAVLLAWGGHLAQSAYWDRSRGGPSDGAGQVSGAPWHMRTLQLDGSGNKNQDRSIQPSAIVGELPPFALAPPAPTPRPTTPPSGPGAAPNPPGGAPGAPGAPGVPGGPTVTVPPTSTSPESLRSGPGGTTSVEFVLVGAFAVLGVALLVDLRRGARGGSRRR